jgi:hypothetical protein
MPVRAGSVSRQIRARHDCQPFGLALEERRIGEERGGDRLEGERGAELRHHVGLGREVEVHLHGAGPVHHLGAVRADLPHIAGHQRVTALGHDRHLVGGPDGGGAQADEAGADAVGDGFNLGEMLVNLVAGFVDGLERRAGEFQLAAGLEADVGAALLQADQMPALHDRRPAEAVAQPFEHGADRAGAFIGQRRQGLEIVAEFLVLGADPPVLGRLAAGFEIRGELGGMLDRPAAGLGYRHVPKGLPPFV